MTDNKLHPYNEAGRRVKAALISYSARSRGVDSTLKRMPEDAGEGWGELAGKLMLLMQNASPAGLMAAASFSKPRSGESSNRPDTTETMDQHLQQVELAARGKEILHLSSCFLGSPSVAGILTCYVTGPDDLVSELKKEVDQTIRAVLERRGLATVAPKAN